MVIRDDHGEAERLGQGDFFHIGNAAIHGNEQIRLLRDLTDGVGMESVAFCMAGRNTVSQGRAFLMQGFHQDGSGADAIGVIIAVYKYGVPAGNGFPEKLHGFRHARQQERIMKIRKGRGKKVLDFFFRLKSAGTEQGRHPAGQGGKGAAAVSAALNKTGVGHGGLLS